jgi:hypothetical protein
MLLLAQPIQSVDDSAVPEVHRRVDDDILDDGVGYQSTWPWALFAAGLAGSVACFFAYTPV